MGRPCGCDQKQDDHREPYRLVLAALEQAAESAEVGGQPAGRADHPYTHGPGGMHPFSACQEPWGQHVPSVRS